MQFEKSHAQVSLTHTLLPALTTLSRLFRSVPPLAASFRVRDTSRLALRPERRAMLATQLFPAASPFSTSHQDSDGAQYRPAKDVEAFNAILPPAIEFVEGSSSGTLSIAETKYEPINSSPKGEVVLVRSHTTPMSHCI
jgi:hypothetical protein